MYICHYLSCYVCCSEELDGGALLVRCQPSLYWIPGQSDLHKRDAVSKKKKKTKEGRKEGGEKNQTSKQQHTSSPVPQHYYEWNNRITICPGPYKVWPIILRASPGVFEPWLPLHGQGGCTCSSWRTSIGHQHQIPGHLCTHETLV